MPKVTEEQKKAAMVADKVANELTGKVSRFDQLPIVSSLFDSTENMNEAISSLTSAIEAKEQMDVLTDRLSKNKEELIATAIGLGVEGFRYGQQAVIVKQQDGASRLDKNLLVENMLLAGMDPQSIKNIISESHIKSDPFYKVELKRIP